jgi:hypothetical protein
MLVGGYATAFLVARLAGFWSSAALPGHQWDPVGLLAPLGAPPSTVVARIGLVATIALGVAFTAGWRWSVTGPAFALAFLAATTFRMSWGHVIHTEHLVAAHVVVIGVASAADAWSLDVRAGRRRPRQVADGRYGWPVRVMCLVVVVAYVLAGIAKVRNGGGEWLGGDVLRNHVAFDNLRKVLLGDPHSPFGAWAVRYGWVFAPMALATVVVELGAPVALAGRRWRTGWVLAAWGFHVGVAALMWISFPYQLTGIAYAAFFRCERVTEWVISAARPRSRRAARTPSRRQASATR